MQRTARFVIAVALLAAACGDGASGATAPDTTSDASLASLPPTTTTAAPPTVADSSTTTTASATTTTVDLAAAEFGSPEIAGDPLPAVGPSPDPAIGMAAPVVAGDDFAGASVTIGEGGAVEALLFVAHWCGHCQQELPEVVAWLHETGGVEGVEFVLVTVGVNPDRPNFPPSAWLEREGWTGPVLRDDAANSTFYAYGGSAVPYWVFLDADGTVAARIPSRASLDDVQVLLQELVAGA